MDWQKDVYKPKRYDSWEKPSQQWLNTKEKVFERDGYTCYACGKGNDLTAHHIKPRKKGGTYALSNLITLCVDCHDEIEEMGIEKKSKIKDILKPIIYENKPIGSSWQSIVYGGCRSNDDS